MGRMIQSVSQSIETTDQSTYVACQSINYPVNHPIHHPTYGYRAAIQATEPLLRSQGFLFPRANASKLRGSRNHLPPPPTVVVGDPYIKNRPESDVNCTAYKSRYPPPPPCLPIQVTRIASVGPADFLCGLSAGGVLRIRPGMAQPCLLAQTSSMLGLSFSTIKRMGVSWWRWCWWWC